MMTNYNNLMHRPNYEVLNFNGTKHHIGMNLDSSFDPRDAANDKSFALTPDANDMRRAQALSESTQMRPDQAMMKFMQLLANDKSQPYSQREQARIWIKQYHTMYRLGMGRMLYKSGHMKNGTDALAKLSPKLRNKYDPEGHLRNAMGAFNPENKVGRGQRVHVKQIIRNNLSQAAANVTKPKNIHTSELNIRENQPTPGMASNLLKNAANLATRRMMPVSVQLAAEMMMPSALRPSGNRRRDPLLQLAA